MDQQLMVYAVGIAESFLLLSAAADNVLFDQKNKKRRSCWVKPWIKRRATHVTIIEELAAEDPSKYKNFFRMSDELFHELLGMVESRIQKQTTNFREPISAKTRLQVTLRYLASGCTFTSLEYMFRVPQNTISTIIPDVLDALYDVLQKKYLKVPSTPDEWQSVAQGFNDRWQFPNCIGAIDGKHINMVAPPNSGSLFFNYKNQHSIVLMAIADSAYKLLYIDVGCPGRTSDGGVFNKSSFANALNTNALNLPPPTPLPGRTKLMPFVLVGDDAFALRVNLLKPFSNRTLVYSERIFNYRLSRARRIIENVFGIMASRFRVLRSDILLDSEKSTRVAKACCVLHNFLMVRNGKQYAPLGTFDTEQANGEIVEGAWRSDQDLNPASRSRPADRVKDVRSEFRDYFVAEGDVEWQHQMV